MTSYNNILVSYSKPWAVQAAGQPFVYFDYNAVGDNTRTYAETGEWERSYTCDLLGRKTTYTEGQLFEEYRYDGQNLSIHIQDWYEDGGVRICTTWYSYTAHRLDSVESDDALTVIYHYNAYGQIDSLYDESGVMCYEYGNMGEVTRETRIYALPFLFQSVALSTQFSYDSWGRVQSITYPDGEVVHYAYDLGGQLERMYNSSYTYLDDVAYDRFGAKVSQTYGNGLQTEYDYWPDTRRLSNVLIQDAYGGTNSSMTYFYDPVGNITQLESEYPWRPGEIFIEEFYYDDADQLTMADEYHSGLYWQYATYGNYGKIDCYSLSGGTQNVEYYTQYPSCPSELESAQTPFAPLHSDHAPSSGYPYPQTTDCTYGINGSLRHKTTCFDPFMQPNAAPMEEFYLFAASGNMQAYCCNYVDYAYYGYDASNTRTYKLRMWNHAQWSNGLPDELDLRAYQAVFYPNQYLTFDMNGNYTKHYYNGTERICSRLGDRSTYIYTGRNARLDSRTAELEYQFQRGMQELISDWMEVHTPHISSISRLQSTGSSTDIYYYSVNHLGSTAFVTDGSCSVTQGFLYAPFGEIIDEYVAIVTLSALPKYAFNAKELDEESGMYYYEARYYNPPVFTSRDPLFEQKPWLTPYHYCSNNPVGRVDPTGMLDDWVEKADGTIYWDDNATSQATTKKGEKYLGKTGVSINEKNGKHRIYKSDGSTEEKVRTLNPVNVTENATEHQKAMSYKHQLGMHEGGISIHPEALGQALGIKGFSVDATFALGPIGMTIEAGVIFDYKSRPSAFLSVGYACGYEKSIGFNALVIPSSNFKKEDLSGLSGNVNISGGKFSVSVMSDIQRGECKDRYFDNLQGGKIGVGYGMGASASLTKTWLSH